MQEGSFRCDANVSVRRPGEPLGTRCEIKNLNSFRFMERAIEFEAKRQIEILEDGGKIVQETRLYDSDKDETRSLRIKEEAHDYRYFPDPDLLPLEVSEEWVERVRSDLPELPQQMAARFVGDYGFAPEHAALLTFDRETAEDFEEFWRQLHATLGPNTEFDEAAIGGANWAMVEFRGMLNAHGIVKVSESPIPPKERAVLVARIIDGTISHKIAKEILGAMWEGEGTADEIIEKRGLKQISDVGAIGKIVEEVLAANAKQVEDYRAGKEKAFNSLVGQVMKATKGKANPAQVNAILKRKLAG
jgi:aspartyl-tRNA(Asn)/glutamyl-tRNA(Gln) amidotransferase subunit B